jgi:hypothetical protein
MRIKILILLLAAQYPASADTLTVGHVRQGGISYEYSSIQAAINAASNGDTVLVTRGVYHENLTISGKIITLASNYINSNDEDDILQTIVDGGRTGSTLEIRNVTTDTVVTGLTFQNGSDGILPYSKFSLLHCRITGCKDGIDYESNSGGICMHNIFEYNNDDGIDLDQDVDIEIANNIIRHNRDDGIEIRLHPYTGSTLTYNIHDNIITGNGEDGIQLIDYDDLSDRVFYIKNNIIADSNQAGVGCMDKGDTNEDYRAASIPEPVYMINNTFYNNLYGITGGDNMVVKNNIFAEIGLIALKEVDGSSSITYNAFWQNGTDFSNTSPGVGNYLNINPLFTDAVNGDYHLQSQAGRWDPNLSDWVVDVNTSPCIDAGDPNSDWTGESWPHGSRINLGAYGRTPQASKSLSTVGNETDYNNDGAVDMKDLLMLADMWLTIDVPLVEDSNRDGVVSLPDFAMLAENWLWHE